VQHKIPVVNSAWVQQSVSKKYMQDEREFSFESHKNEHDYFDKENRSNIFVMNTQLPAVASNNNNNNSVATISSSSFIRQPNDSSSLVDCTAMDLIASAPSASAATAQLSAFVQGSASIFAKVKAVFLGYTQDMYKIVTSDLRARGGTPCNSINISNLSHVILFKPTEKELKQVFERQLGAVVVKHEWYIQSIKSNRYLDTGPYLWVKEQLPQPLPSASVSSVSASLTASRVSPTAGSESVSKLQVNTITGNNNNANTSISKIDIPSFNFSTLITKPQPQHEEKPLEEAQPLIPLAATTPLSKLFTGLKFAFHQASLSSVLTITAEKLISDNSGVIVTKYEQANYLICGSVVRDPKPIVNCECVTIRWIEDCCEAQQIHSVSLKIPYMPIFAKTVNLRQELGVNLKHDNEVNICMTGIHNEMKRTIMDVINFLGGKIIAKLTKDVDILICEDANSDKTLKAHSKKMPVVVKEWVFESAKMGHFVNPTPFSVQTNQSQFLQAQQQDQPQEKKKQELDQQPQEQQQRNNSKSEQSPAQESRTKLTVDVNQEAIYEHMLRELIHTPVTPKKPPEQMLSTQLSIMEPGPVTNEARVFSRRNIEKGVCT